MVIPLRWLLRAVCPPLRLVLPPLGQQLLLQMIPHHVDSLLQLSDICRMQEDQEMAGDLIGKGWRGVQVLGAPSRGETLSPGERCRRHPQGCCPSLAWG